MIYRENFDEVDTFESFYKNIINRNNIIVIPFINVAISRHPLNPTDELMYIDRSYVVCINACIKDINGKFTDSCNEAKFNDPMFLKLGGVDLEIDQHTGIRIICEDVFLETLPDSRIGNSFWIPVKTPNFYPSMDTKEVNDFFQYKNLPNDIKQLIGGNVSK